MRHYFALQLLSLFYKIFMARCKLQTAAINLARFLTLYIKQLNMDKHLTNETEKTGLHTEAVINPQQQQWGGPTGAEKETAANPGEKPDKEIPPKPDEKPEKPAPETEKPDIHEMPKTRDNPEVEKTDIEEMPDTDITDIPGTDITEMPDTSIEEMPDQTP
jgi:outer membrane biosynthesis protein TonB